MRRAVKKGTPLTPDELREIFELASRGRGQEEAQQRLPSRNRTTISRTYNVAVEFELRRIETLDNSIAAEVAEAARYGTTITGVKDLFLQWREWKKADGRKSSGAQTLEEMRRHWREDLLPTIRELEGVEPLTHSGQEILPWWLRTQEPSWPIAKGRVIRIENGSVSIRLFVEDRLEWEYLRQHLVGDPVWEALDRWKAAMAGDLVARRALFDKIKEATQSSTTLPVLQDISGDSGTEPYIHPYYLTTIYDQIVRQVIGMSWQLIRREEFRTEGATRIFLSGFLMFVSPDPKQVDCLISLLLETQTKFVDMDEAKAAGMGCGRAKGETAILKQHVRRILLSLGLPPGSMCDGCRAWLTVN